MTAKDERAYQINPGNVPLAAWRDIYFGATVTLDPAARSKVETAARVIDEIIAKGDPV